MATHSSTLAWKIPWAEEPGGLQSMGSLRVRHDWATSLSLFTFMHWRRKWQPTPVFLPGKSQGRGSLVGCHLWGHRVGHDWSDLAAGAVAGWLVSVSRYISLIMTHSYYNLVVQSFQCIWGYLGIISGEGNGKPLQYSCLENSLDRRAWQATVHEVARVGHDLVTNHHHHQV